MNTSTNKVDFKKLQTLNKELEELKRKESLVCEEHRSVTDQEWRGTITLFHEWFTYNKVVTVDWKVRSHNMNDLSNCVLQLGKSCGRDSHYRCGASSAVKFLVVIETFVDNEELTKANIQTTYDYLLENQGAKQFYDFAFNHNSFQPSPPNNPWGKKTPEEMMLEEIVYHEQFDKHMKWVENDVPVIRSWIKKQTKENILFHVLEPEQIESLVCSELNTSWWYLKVDDR